MTFRYDVMKYEARCFHTFLHKYVAIDSRIKTSKVFFIQLQIIFMQTFCSSVCEIFSNLE